MKKIELSQGRLIGLIAVGALIGSVAGSVGLSFADGNRSTTNLVNNINKIVVPYDGYLMLDSAPVNGTQTMRFTLYESASGNTGQWAEAHNVTINDGRFSVTLGNGANVLSSTPGAPSPLPHATFNDAILDAEKLFIGIEVEDAANPGTYIALAGRQAIEAAPFAAWSARSADFGVEGELNVKGNAEVGGVLEVKGADLLLGTENTARGNGGRALVKGSGDALLVNFAGDFTGGTVVQSNLGVTGSTTMQSASATSLSTSGNLSVSGTTTSTGRLTASSGITLGNDQSITGVDVIQGFNDLRLYGDPSGGSTGDLIIDAAGDVSIRGDLSVTGKINGLSRSTEYVADSNMNSGSQPATVDMINVNDGFCFFSLMWVNHNANDPSPMGCRITNNGTNWRLEARGDHANAHAFGACRAICIRY